MAPRRRAGLTGIDQIGRRGTVKAGKQRGCLAVVLGHFDVVRCHLAQKPRDLPTDRVIASVRITDAQYDPAGSGVRHGLPSIQLEPQEMRRAGDTGVVVAYRLLAAMAKLVIGQIEKTADVAREILLDAGLVL